MPRFSVDAVLSEAGVGVMQRLAVRSYSAKLIAIGMVVLVAALLASLASMMPRHAFIEVGPAVLYSGKGLVSVVAAELLNAKPSEGVRVNLTIYNNDCQPVEVHILPYTGVSTVIEAHSFATFTDVVSLDNIILRSNSSVNVSVQATAVIVQRPYAVLAVVGLVLFLSGSTILSLGVILRLAGIEGAETHN